MEFFRQGAVYDFMRLRTLNMTISGLTFAAAIFFWLVWPQPNLGLDFRGGTELEIQFAQPVSVAELRQKLTALGQSTAEVITVQNARNQYIIRVRSTSSLSDSTRRTVLARLRRGIDSASVRQTKFSPGGDKISLRLSADVEPARVQEVLVESGVRVREVVRFGQRQQNRYEALLVGISDEIMSGLEREFGERLRAPAVDPERPPPDPLLRTEWVGPKAGAQLRDAALQSLLYAIIFIMVYVAFRFDVRFAPGGVVAMAHDAIITFGLLVLLRQEITLTTIAALLTIIGYSINDTVVVYDRIRENVQKLRGRSLTDIINVSTSEMLSRTLLTGGATLLSLVALYAFGTQVIKDFALTLFLGIVIGTYSSIYVAAPITEWLDRRLFRRMT